jgi:hypothetical protein
MPRRTWSYPELFIPTWLFPEEMITAGLAGLDDDTLRTIHLGRFVVGLQERTREGPAPRRDTRD